MGRLRAETVQRSEQFAYRMLDVAEALSDQNRSRRIVDQIIGCGTSVGANACEASEAMSRADFAKTLSISIKELCEAQFWLRLAVARGWVSAEKLASLQSEAAELKRMFGAMVSRTRARRIAR